MEAELNEIAEALRESQRILDNIDERLSKLQERLNELAMELGAQVANGSMEE